MIAKINPFINLVIIYMANYFRKEHIPAVYK